MTPTTRQTSWQRLRAELQPALLAGVPEHLQRLAWSAEQIHAAQQNGLRRLLAHAVMHALFHRRRLAGIDVHRLEPADLSSLPVMTKADMMAALEEVLTDQRLTRNLVEQALAATAAEPVPILDDYVALATGGSSGQRGVHVFDRAALVGYASSLARPLLARLHALGGPPPGGLPIAMVAAVSAVHGTGLGPAFAGPGMPFQFLPVPVTLPLPQIVERLNTLQAPIVYGYSSMLARLAADPRGDQRRLPRPRRRHLRLHRRARGRQRTRRQRAGVQHRHVHRRARRRRQPARPSRRPVGQGAGDQPVQPS